MLLNEVRPAQKKWLDVLNEVVEFQNKKTDEEAAAGLTTYNDARLFMFSLAGAALLLGMLITWFITRSIIRPINEAVIVAGLVAAGDLTSHIEVKSSDETGLLLQSLKDMNDNLVGIVSDVRGSLTPRASLGGTAQV